MPKCIICHVYKFWSNETGGISLGALSSSLFSCLPTCPHHTMFLLFTQVISSVKNIVMVLGWGNKLYWFILREDQNTDINDSLECRDDFTI